MTTEKGTRRRTMQRRRAPAGSTMKRAKSTITRRMRKAIRSLNSAGFNVGRKLVVSEDRRTIAIAFPNYIRAQRDHSRRPGEATLMDFYALVALHFEEAKLLKG